MNIPLRCRKCGNAVRRPALSHEEGAQEISVNNCPECDEGGTYEEVFYTAPNGKEMTYIQWMEFRGLEP